MNLKVLENVQVNRYQTRFLTDVRNDSLSDLAIPGRWAYLTDYATNWIARKRGRTLRPGNRALQRKWKMFQDMPDGACILSTSRPALGSFGLFATQREGRVIHMGALRLPGLRRLLDVVYSVRMVLSHRDLYDVLVFYNYYPTTCIPAALAKVIYGKRIILDYEDGYYARNGWLVVKLLERVVRPLLDAAILINGGLSRRLREGLPCVVKNSFSDLSHVRDGVETERDESAPVRMVFSGSWDRIRGADLISEFSCRLSERGIRHRIFVTGFSGDYEPDATSSPNVRVLGYLGDDDLSRLLSDSDVGLVFQKPDHPFSVGSFPSKIDLYSEYRLPCLVLVPGSS